MRVRRRAFALMLVLLASAAVLATAMHGAVVMRASTVETAAVTDRAHTQRLARSAAVLVLRGLLSTVGEPTVAQLDAADRARDRAGAAGPDDDDEPTPDEIELPPIIRQLLGEQADELEDELTDRNTSRAAARELAGSRRVLGRELLERVGLPGRPLAFALDARPIRVRLTDATAGLNVNEATADQLVRLLLARGLEPALAESIAHQILDWRDEDDFPRNRGAETDRYARLGVAQRNAPFDSLEELLYLPSMSRELLAALENDLSLSGDGPHLAAASPAVLFAHGFTERDVAIILQRRAIAPIDADDFKNALSPAGTKLLDRARLRTSSLIRVEVEVFERLARLERTTSRTGDATRAGAIARTDPNADTLDVAVGLRFDERDLVAPRRFVGLAVLGDDGLRDLMLRPAFDERPTPPRQYDEATANPTANADQGDGPWR